ncbi:MAG: prepilin-type N-terminal cleavage/methylation domain-containing protein [Planctomycetes bacterium]|nr:prepilin-type N-terminal cleavage/methylation domain-containing protein [Planctomycetota bacterium]
MKRQQRGFTVLEVLIVIVVIGIIAALAIPGMISSQRSSYERNASTSLKTVSVAEADFRHNDRDANKVNDYWTADLKGLYTMTSATTLGNAGGTVDPPLRLIELSLATADADSVVATAGGENMDIAQLGVVSAKGGYWFAALTLDNTVSGAESSYRQDTGGEPDMGSVHNLNKYAFVSFPEGPSYGKYAFILNENNQVFRNAITTPVRLGTANPPGANGFDPVYKNWPNDTVLKANWSKLD